MHSLGRSAIGWAMVLYRASPLHNPFFGAWLAKLLHWATGQSGRRVIQEIRGIRYELDLTEVIDSSLYYSGTFEPKVENLISGSLRPGMNAIDIGANVGYHTFRMALQVQPGGQVFAVEPTSTAYSRLLRNSTLNPQITNVEFINVGLTDRDLGEQHVAFRSSYRLDGSVDARAEDIMLICLDTLVQRWNLDRLDFIKIDVDGFEGKVIKGGMRTLRRFLPTLVMEFTPSEIAGNGDATLAILRLFEELHYRFCDEAGRSIDDIERHVLRLPEGFSTMLLAVPKPG